MDLDDPVCLCFHVTKRKLVAFVRVTQPKVASQLSQCGSAGTGCGWCVPFLKKIFADGADQLPPAAEYAAGRQMHIQEGKGTPPS